MSLANVTSNGEIFLQNNYISIGLNAQGTLGTRTAAPDGIATDIGHGYMRLGFYADTDGFGQGRGTTMRDAILPGTAIETFAIGYSQAGTQSVFTNSGLDGKRAITGTSSSSSTATKAQATWSGQTETNLNVKQTISLSPDSEYLRFDVVLTNNTGDAISNVRYLRSIDPDQNPSSFATYNKVVLQGEGKALVTAGASASSAPLFLYAVDSRATVSIYGFENFSPYDAGVLKGQAAGYAKSADVALNLNFDLGTILSGQSKTITFYLGMTADLSGTIAEINKGSTSTPPTDPVPANTAPIAVADKFNLDAGATLKGNVLTNDRDAEGDALKASVKVGPANGTLSLNADGTFTYVPKDGFSGTDSFTYTASDGKLTGATTVQIVVNPAPNSAPTAKTDSVTVVAGASATGKVLANDTDADGDTLTAALVTGPSNGTLKLNADGSFTYTPKDGFSGTDSFVYKASDGKLSDNATVKITVNPAPNSAPTAKADSVTVTAGASATGKVLANDTDVDGDTLTAALVTGPSNGTLTLNVDGSFTYTPKAGFSGTDSFVYKASDGKLSDNATVKITVNPAPNSAPTAKADSLTVMTGSSATGKVLANDTDADGDTLTAALVTGPSNGTLTLNSDGSFTYTPKAGFSGTDSFVYKASDGKLSDNATVKITVNSAPNTAPTAKADSVTVTAGASATGKVLANDTDADGDTLTAALVTGPSNGTLKLNADGSFTYTPKAGFSGTDSFTYKASDGKLSDNATVKITVNPAANSAPTAKNDSANAVAGESVSGNVLANDTDADGNSLSAKLISGPEHGTVKLSADGSYIYTADKGYVGSDSFTYAASDGKLSDQAKVTIAVDAPRPVSILDKPGTIDLSGSGSDKVTGEAYHNIFFVDSTDVSGQDTITNFGANDILALKLGLYDSNGDGFIFFKNNTLDVDAKLGRDTVTLTGSSSLRLMGEVDGLALYASGSTTPNGARESLLGDDVLRGDAAGASKQVFFFDTGLDLDLGNDQIQNFDNKDLIVTTSALKLVSGKRLVDFGGDAILDLVGGSGAPDDSKTPGEAGHVQITGVDGSAVGALEYDGTATAHGVTYYVYSAVGSAAGVADLLL